MLSNRWTRDMIERMTRLKVTNPYNSEIIAELGWADAKSIQAALDSAMSAFERWRKSSSYDRSRVLEGIASRLEARAEEIAKLISAEAGKPISFSRIEVARAIGVFRWAAAEAQRFSGELLRLDTASNGRSGFGIHTRFPRGVILGITPFNFPLNLVAHKVAPAIASGNVIVIKPSPFTPLTSLKLAEIVSEASTGLPTPLMQVVLANDAPSRELTQAKEIAMVSFTGSARVGHLIRSQAPGKPVALELGGNAWVIVMDDTPPDALAAIAKRIAGAAFGYAGQSCISVQNVAVAPGLWPALREKLEEAVKATPYGDPSLDQVLAGPVIHAGAADRIRKMLEGAPRNWQRIESTGKQGTGAPPPLVTPALLIRDGMIRPENSLSPLVQEEIFGPVMVGGSFNELSSLIATVNSSPYGLQAGVFTRDFGVIERLYQELQVGGLVVNDVPTTRYDHQPYGGVKDSGQGREGVRYAMEEMCESKFLALSSQLPL